MGKLCSCNFCIKGEDKKEFNGFSASPINNDDKYIYIIKKQFRKYNQKDKKFYQKSQDYDKMVENTSIQDIEINDEPIEENKGSIQIIRWNNAK